MSFNDILIKKECPESVYNQYKELFDAAVKSGLISMPQKFEKTKITHGKTEEINYSYRWKLNER